MWSQIGVKLELQQVDNATRTQTIPRRRLRHARSVPGPTTSPTRTRSPPTSSIPRTSTRCIPAGRATKANELFEASQKEIDQKKRAEQYAEIQKIYNATGPIVPLYETPYPVALRDNVHGFLQIPLGNNIFRATWMDK